MLHVATSVSNRGKIISLSIAKQCEDGLMIARSNFVEDRIVNSSFDLIIHDIDCLMLGNMSSKRLWNNQVLWSTGEKQRTRTLCLENLGF